MPRSFANAEAKAAAVKSMFLEVCKYEPFSTTWQFWSRQLWAMEDTPVIDAPELPGHLVPAAARQ